MDGFNFNSRMNTTSCSFYGTRNTDSTYPDFEGVQDLSYSAAENCAQELDIPVHDDQACMDLSLLLSSSKDCDRQQIEDELPLNLTGKAREEEINRRLRQRQQYCNTYNYSYSYPFCDPPRSSQVFVAPDYLGMHELQDLSLRTHSYMDDTTSLNLSYCPQTLDLSAQSLDLSLNGLNQDLSYDNCIVDLSAPHNLNLDYCDIINLTCQGDSETNQAMLHDLLHQQQHPLPPASSLPLPLSITQSLTATSCSNQQYAALDLQKNSCVVQQPTAEITSTVPVAQEKKYICAQCGERFITTD